MPKILDKKRKLVILDVLDIKDMLARKIFFSKNICTAYQDLTSQGIAKLNGNFEILFTQKFY